MGYYTAVGSYNKYPWGILMILTHKYSINQTKYIIVNIGIYLIVRHLVTIVKTTCFIKLLYDIKWYINYFISFNNTIIMSIHYHKRNLNKVFKRMMSQTLSYIIYEESCVPTVYETTS